MLKIDQTVKRETLNVALWVLILSAIMQGVCIVASWWSVKVLLGNILGAFIAVVNFFLLGLTVQTAILKDKETAKNTVRLSMAGRMLLIAVAAFVGAFFFNIYTTLIPLLFPRFIIVFRARSQKNTDEPISADIPGDSDNFDDSDKADNADNAENDGD